MKRKWSWPAIPWENIALAWTLLWALEFFVVLVATDPGGWWWLDAADLGMWLGPWAVALLGTVAIGLWNLRPHREWVSVEDARVQHRKEPQ